MRALYLTAAALAAATPVAIYAQAAPRFTTEKSTIQELVDNPEAKAVLQKHLPQVMEYVGMIGGQTLKQLQGMSGGQLSDSLLATVDADLANIK